MADHRLHLVACTAIKATTPQPAADLYRSDWFTKARAYVEAIGAPWLILSAEHGLLDPREIVAPYDKALTAMSWRQRRKWGEPIAARLAALGDVPIVILAGRVYRDAILTAPSGAALNLIAPMGGLGIGEQKSWLLREAGFARGELARPDRRAGTDRRKS